MAYIMWQLKSVLLGNHMLNIILIAFIIIIIQCMMYEDQFYRFLVKYLKFVQMKIRSLYIRYLLAWTYNLCHTHSDKFEFLPSDSLYYIFVFSPVFNYCYEAYLLTVGPIWDFSLMSHLWCQTDSMPGDYIAWVYITRWMYFIKAIPIWTFVSRIG